RSKAIAALPAPRTGFPRRPPRCRAGAPLRRTGSGIGRFRQASPAVRSFGLARLRETGGGVQRRLCSHQLAPDASVTPGGTWAGAVYPPEGSTGDGCPPAPPAPAPFSCSISTAAREVPAVPSLAN